MVVVVCVFKGNTAWIDNHLGCEGCLFHGFLILFTIFLIVLIFLLSLFCFLGNILSALWLFSITTA